MPARIIAANKFTLPAIRLWPCQARDKWDVLNAPIEKLHDAKAWPLLK
jgi:hypothetical protein